MLTKLLIFLLFNYLFLLVVYLFCFPFIIADQKIWDEVGEPDAERDTMVQDIEQECLEVYKSKIDEVKKCRAQMQHEIAMFQTEFADICYAMSEQPPHVSRI